MLTVGVTWLIVDRVGLSLSELADVDLSAWEPDLLLLAAASALHLAAYFGSGTLWGLIVRDLGGPRLAARESVRLFVIANLGRYIPGKVWQIAGLAALAKSKGVPAKTTIGAAVVGQGIALVAASAIGLGALLSGPESYQFWGRTGAVFVAIGILFVSIPRVFRHLAQFWFRVSGTDSHEGLGALHGLRWLGLYFVNWWIYSLSFWLLVQSLGIQGEVVPVASAFAAAYVLGYVMLFAPAGLGPREGFLIVFLTPHMGVATAGIVAVIARLWITLVEVVPAGVIWVEHVARAGGTTADGSQGGNP